MSHLSDRDLLLYLDGECPAARVEAIADHLHQCDGCRFRKDELSSAAREFEKQYEALDVPPIQEPRTSLLAELNKIESRFGWRERMLVATAAAVLIGLTLRTSWPVRLPETDFAPVPSLTPGATRAISRAEVCADESEHGELRMASKVASQVFHNYGIDSPAPRSYEIDYLIPADLGGSDDPRNLWPQPYARGVWNARVKDALEDRLRALVCSGKLDLATAQRDLARDWIGAYKRYFRTDKPLLDHVAFYKDRPWE